MNIFELFILAIGLSMDAFAVSVCKGLSLGRINAKHMCIAGAWFGGFQALMPLVGYFGGRFFADKVTRYSHWVAFVLLVFIGAGMIKESKEEEHVNADMDIKSMFILAVATSIDALAVGVTFAFLKVEIVSAVSFIGVITFVCSAAGVKIGSLFRNEIQIQSGIMRRYYPYPHRYKNPAGRTGNDINNNYKSQLKRVIILLLMNRHEMIIRLNNLNNISGRFLL